MSKDAFTLAKEKKAKSTAMKSVFYKGCLSFCLTLKELFKLEHMFK
jgi:hypothetical protein